VKCEFYLNCIILETLREVCYFSVFTSEEKKLHEEFLAKQNFTAYFIEASGTLPTYGSKRCLRKLNKEPLYQSLSHILLFLLHVNMSTGFFQRSSFMFQSETLLKVVLVLGVTSEATILSSLIFVLGVNPRVNLIAQRVFVC
jgi:hypothetical protein